MSLTIVYMGTPAFAVPPLRRLLQSSHEVRAVVCQPDRPAGRGRKLQMPPVKELALEHGLPVLQPEKIRGQRYDQVLKFYKPDILVVVAYGKILPKEVLECARFGALNIHGSLLPKWRGAAPIQWAIINGDKQTGVTLMQLDEGMDTGPIIAAESIDLLEDDDYVSVSNMLSVIGAELLVRQLDQIEADGKVSSTPQVDELATHARMLTKADGVIDWSQGMEEICWAIKGLQPWPSAMSFLNGKLWKFLKAQPVYEWDMAEALTHMTENPDTQPPGTVTGIVSEAPLEHRGFYVRTGVGHIFVKAAQVEGKKAMTGAEIVSGNLIAPGRQFVSDTRMLTSKDELS